MHVRDVIRRKGGRVILIGPDATVADAITLMVRNNIGSLPVAEPDGRLVGIVSERDLLRGLHEQGDGFEQVGIAEVMTPDPRCCDIEDDVEAVMRTMSDFRVAKVPVLCDGKLCGIVSVGDVVKELYERVRSENQHLQSYIQGSTY